MGLFVKKQQLNSIQISNILYLSINIDYLPF